MRCKICNADSDSVSLVDDCADCQQAIFECLSGYPDNDDLVDPDLDDDYLVAL